MNDELKRQGLLLALERKELDEFLCGSGMYRLGYNPYNPGNSMLNLDISMSTIYEYYIEEPDKRVDLNLEETLIDWLKWKSGIGVFAVFDILSYQLIMEKNNKSPFRINSEKIITVFKAAFNKYKDKLENIKEYEGENLKRGLLEAIEITNERNNKEYGINILGA